MWSQWRVWPGLVSISVDSEFMSVPWQWNLICLVDIRSDPCPKREKTLTEEKHSNWQLEVQIVQQGGKKWQLSCCQKLLWQLRMTISVEFLLIWIFILSWQQRKQKSGQKDIERFRINIKMRKAGKTTHGPFSLAFLGLGEPKHDAVIYISISSSSVPSQTRDELSPEQDPSQKAGLQTVCGNVPLTTTKPPPPPSPPPPDKCVCCNAIALQITEERNACSSL